MMKKIGLIILMCLVLGNFSAGDTYLKEVSRTETYVDGKLTDSKQVGVNEVWIAENKIAYITPPRILIVDRSERKVIIANRKAKTYVETSLPLDLSEILAEEVKKRFKMYYTSGIVNETGNTKKIKGMHCQHYEVNYQYKYGDTVGREMEFDVWATTDVPIDLELYGIMLQNMRQIVNRDEKLRNELDKIKGIQVYLEMTTEEGNTTSKYIDEDAEMSEKEPPTGIYSIPSGFAKKDKLTLQDVS
jgi:hypothetical protein